MNKQLLDKLEELQLPKIKKILIKLGNMKNDNEHKCDYCNVCWKRPKINYKRGRDWPI